MRPELRAALHAFAAHVNQLAARGQLPQELGMSSYQLMAALDLPDNEVPLPIQVVVRDGG
jgi:hypothetical protein